MPKTSAFAYLRVSGAGQAMEGKDGLDRQRRAIQRYTKAKGLNIVAEFADKGVKGELADRPALGDMLAELMADGVRVVVVENASRLARDLAVQELLLGKLRGHGVAVHSTAAGGDLLGLDDPDDEQKATRTLIRQILGAVSEFEKAMIVLKLRAARERKRREEGRCEGAKPFGQTDTERRIVATIKALRRKPRGGKPRSFRAIAQTLNEHGLPARRGGGWHASTVRGVCQSPIFRAARVAAALDIGR